MATFSQIGSVASIKPKPFGPKLTNPRVLQLSCHTVSSQIVSCLVLVQHALWVSVFRCSGACGCDDSLQTLRLVGGHL